MTPHITLRHTEGLCPDCGRTKAIDATTAGMGHCPKHWAIRDPSADEDCRRAAAANPLFEMTVQVPNESTLAKGMKLLGGYVDQPIGTPPRKSPWPLLQLAQLTDGPPSEASRGKWFIVETYLSTNGPRTRLCDGRFNTRAEAQAELDDKEKQLGR